MLVKLRGTKYNKNYKNIVVKATFKRALNVAYVNNLNLKRSF